MAFRNTAYLAESFERVITSSYKEAGDTNPTPPPIENSAERSAAAQDIVQNYQTSSLESIRVTSPQKSNEDKKKVTSDASLEGKSADESSYLLPTNKSTGCLKVRERVTVPSYARSSPVIVNQPTSSFSSTVGLPKGNQSEGRPTELEQLDASQTEATRVVSPRPEVPPQLPVRRMVSPPHAITGVGLQQPAATPVRSQQPEGVLVRSPQPKGVLVGSPPPIGLPAGVSQPIGLPTGSPHAFAISAGLQQPFEIPARSLYSFMIPTLSPQYIGIPARSPHPIGIQTGSPQPFVMATGSPHPMGIATGSPQPMGIATGSPQPMGIATGSPQPMGIATGSPQPMGIATGSPQPMGIATGSPHPMGIPARSPQPIGIPTRSPHHKGVPSGSPHHKGVPSGSPHHKGVPSGSPHHKGVPSGSPYHKGVPSRSPHPNRVPSGSPHSKGALAGSPQPVGVPVDSPQPRRTLFGLPQPNVKQEKQKSDVDEKAKIPTGNKFHESCSMPSITKAFAEAVLEASSIEDTHNTRNNVYLLTRNPSHSFDFEWCLTNFSSYAQNVRSPVFSSGDCPMTWQASVSLNRLNGYLDFYFEMLSDCEDCVNVGFKLGIYNKKGEIYMKSAKCADFDEKTRKHMCFKTSIPPIETDCKFIQPFEVYDDELIIKGRITCTGCCISTIRLSQPKLKKSSKKEKF